MKRHEGWGEYQAKQGVLFWNMSPTTTPERELHTNIWGPITQTIFTYLLDKPALAWLVFLDEFVYNVPSNHLYLLLGTPNKMWLDQRPFTAINKYLEANGSEVIVW